MAKLVSKVYGDALFETAMEKELVDTFYEETSALLPILQANPELFSVLGNPQIVKEEKVALLHQVFSGKIAEAKLRDVNKEAESILETARRKAKAREEEMLDEAKAEAARIIERANREVELEKKKALDDMKQEIVDIAAFMAEKVVGNSIDVKIQDALIDETLKEMGEHTWQS